MTSPLQALLAASGLIVFHAPDGHEIFINPAEVTMLHQKLVQSKGNFTENANCLINTTDGKFVTVIENCLKVLDAMKAGR